MFDDITKFFDRRFIVAFYLPSWLFACAQLPFLLFVSRGSSFEGAIKASDLTTKLGISIVLASVLAILLQQAMRPIIRFFEGYGCLRRWSWLQSSKNVAFARLATEHAVTKKLYDEACVADDEEGRAVPVDLLARYATIRRRWLGEFPQEESLVMPTSLGNVIRAFEYYPKAMYGMDAIILWPRLQIVASPRSLQTVQDAQASFTFPISMMTWGTTFCAEVVLACCALWRVPMLGGSTLAFWCGVVMAPIMCLVCYRSSIQKAREWGEAVKSCFDLFRLDLIVKLGLKAPVSLAEERSIWDDIVQFFAFADEREFSYAKRDSVPKSPQTDSEKAPDGETADDMEVGGG